MTPEEQDAWHETLRRMREERDRAAEEERKLAQERAWRDEQRRLADEAKASKAARLARRTPEEIAYDEALERRAKAEARVEEDWTDCLKKAVANNEECLKKAEKAWHDCRDSAAKDSLACDAACLLTGPLFLDCLAVCVANWARMRANCDKAYLDAKLECGNALVKAKDECSDEFIKTLRRIREDHPVPPKPASHDY